MKKEAIVVIIGLCIITSIIVISLVSAINLMRDSEQTEVMYTDASNVDSENMATGNLFAHSGPKNSEKSELNSITSSYSNSYSNFSFLKNEFNGSLGLIKLNIPLYSEHMAINAEKVKIVDTSSGYRLEYSGAVTIADFNGRLLLEQGKLYLTGSMKQIKTNSTIVDIGPAKEVNVEIDNGDIILEYASIKSIDSIATGKATLSNKFDLKLDNDGIAINGFEGSFRIGSNANANLNGKVNSVSIDGQFFTVTAKS